MTEELTYEKVLKLFAETDRKFAETDKKIAETSEQMRETDRLVKSIAEQLGGISNNNGSVAEEYFYNSFDRKKEFAHQHFDFIERNKEKSNGKQRAEFDIVMYNGKAIAIIEVKYKPHLNDIEKVLVKKEKFRNIVSYAKDKTIYLGLAGLAFPLDVETAALESGIAVIKQVGDNMVILDERIKKF